MSHVIIVERNRNGKIELTKEELQEMLNDAYNKGYSDGSTRWSTITYPSYPVYCTTQATQSIPSTGDCITVSFGDDISSSSCAIATQKGVTLL